MISVKTRAAFWRQIQGCRNWAAYVPPNILIAIICPPPNNKTFTFKLLSCVPPPHLTPSYALGPILLRASSKGMLTWQTTGTRPSQGLRQRLGFGMTVATPQFPHADRLYRCHPALPPLAARCALHGLQQVLQSYNPTKYSGGGLRMEKVVDLVGGITG